MGTKLNITYDAVGDILYIETVKPYSGQATEHLGPDVLGRLNPRTGEIENIEILFFTRRAKARKRLALPVLAQLRRTSRRARSAHASSGPRRSRSK